jgi:putative membrane protein
VNAGETLATVNASLNAASALLLVGGRLAIRRKLVEKHRRYMIAAFSVSTVFLVCYLVRVALTGTHRYPGTGAMKVAYLSVLFTHMTAAAATPLLAIRALWLGLRRRFDAHRRIVRYAFPIWMYVSMTGVLVYLMLYRF